MKIRVSTRWQIILWVLMASLACFIFILSDQIFAQVVDFAPPSDSAGRWQFDLYDTTGTQRGTSSNPMYFGRTWSLTSTADSITTTTSQLPASLGQKTMASSLAVTVASDNGLANSALQTLILNALTASTDPVRPSYSVAAGGFNWAANATDVFTICGSSSKIVRVLKVEYSAIQTTAAVRDVFLIKRSSADTGGTSTSASAGIVKHDSSDAAATASVLVYTANPTLGTQVGIFRARKVLVAASGNAADYWQADFSNGNVKPIYLRGTAECLAINLNGVGPSGTGSADMDVTWTEDTQ